MDLLALVVLVTPVVGAQDAAAATSTGLRPEGWVFMILSVSFVTVLTAWCFYKVLTASEQES